MTNLKKKLTVRVEEEKLEQIRLSASELGLSLDGYINYFLSVVAGKKIVDHSILSDDTVEFKAKWRLSETQNLALKKAASANGWSLSKEAKFRVVSSLINEPAFYPDEVSTLRGLRSAVDTVGRNLNYIIVGKRKVVVNDPLFKKDIDLLLMEIQLIKKKIDVLTETAVNRSSRRLSGAR